MQRECQYVTLISKVCCTYWHKSDSSSSPINLRLMKKPHLKKNNITLMAKQQKRTSCTSLFSCLGLHYPLFTVYKTFWQWKAKTGASLCLHRLAPVSAIHPWPCHFLSFSMPGFIWQSVIHMISVWSLIGDWWNNQLMSDRWQVYLLISFEVSHKKTIQSHNYTNSTRQRQHLISTIWSGSFFFS